jgi:hypothetical protein
MRPNARHQARRTAGATEERTLFAVACMPLFGLYVADMAIHRSWLCAPPHCSIRTPPARYLRASTT